MRTEYAIVLLCLALLGWGFPTKSGGSPRTPRKKKNFPRPDGHGRLGRSRRDGKINPRDRGEPGMAEAGLTNDEIAYAYRSVMNVVKGEFRPGTYRYELAVDRVTNSFLQLVKKWKPQPGQPNSFVGFAIVCCKKAMIEVHGHRDLQTLPITAPWMREWMRDQSERSPPTAPDHSLTIDIEHLPPAVRNACYLHHVLGFSIVDSALLLGQSHQNVKKQLNAAVTILNAA